MCAVKSFLFFVKVNVFVLSLYMDSPSWRADEQIESWI